MQVAEREVRKEMERNAFSKEIKIVICPISSSAKVK